jgi:hypothetical protein
MTYLAGSRVLRSWTGIRLITNLERVLLTDTYSLKAITWKSCMQAANIQTVPTGKVKVTASNICCACRRQRTVIKRREITAEELTLSSMAQVICDLAFLNAYSSKIS